jgi:hypothetical protein
MQFYRDILDAYNILIKEDIISFIQNSVETFDSLIGLTNCLNYFDLFNHDSFKKQSKNTVFLITKDYYESELFKKNWKEATEMNKENIVLVLNKNDKLDINDFKIKFENYKIFEINCDNMFEALKSNEKFYEFFIEIKKSILVSFSFFLNLLFIIIF